MINKQQSITSKALIVFCIAAGFYVYDFLLQVSGGVLSHQLMQEFGITAAELGSIIGVYFYTYTLFQIPAGLCLDKFGARRMLLIMITTCSCGTLLFAFAPNIWVIAIARLIMGGASAFAFLTTLFLIIRWFPVRYFAPIAGILQLLGSIGAIFGETPLAIMVNHIGWRHSILCFAVVGFILLILVFLFVRDLPDHAKYKSYKRDTMGLWHRLKIVCKKRQTWAIALYSFAIWAPIATFAALWGVPFLSQAYQYSPIEAATGIAFIWAGIGIASPLIGLISEATGRRKPLLVTVGLLGLISSLGIVFLQGYSVYLIFGLLFLMGMAASGQTLSFAVIKDNHTLSTMSAANGLNNMSVVFGGAIFQPLVGKLLDKNWSGKVVGGVPQYSPHNYHIALLLLPICFLVAMIMGLFFVKETRCTNIYRQLQHPSPVKKYNLDTQEFA